MSEENVETVRWHIDAYLSGDFAAALGAYSRDVEIDVTSRPDGSVYRGREGVIEAFRVWRGTFENWEGEVEEVIDAGDRVLVVLHESGRGKASGVKVEQNTYFVYSLRDGMIVHTVVLLDKDEALELARPREYGQ